MFIVVEMLDGASIPAPLFLHHFDILSAGFKQRGVCVPDGVEADPLRDPSPPAAG
jgi:hypothetical protein